MNPVADLRHGRGWHHSIRGETGASVYVGYGEICTFGSALRHTNVIVLLYSGKHF